MRPEMASLSDADGSFCIPLNTPGATLARTGGKGLNLAKLAQAGFHVPGGFIVTTAGYDSFVESAGLAGWMAAEVAGIDASDPDALAALSDRLRARLRESAIPQKLGAQMRAAYAELGLPRVAVRSSATAEDLPDTSFAGQQDTILNVLGTDALLAAVVDCWSSLWTARAIGYRARNGIDQSTVSLAVVVQRMVQSETAGVLFTANPLTGRRTETVIDATFGLGEALVGGLVEPDHYAVDSATGRVLSKQLGAKATIIRGLADGGIETTQGENAAEQALSDAQIKMLTALGQRVAALYDFPQDIEWAFAGGELYLLQSRPITSLFPVPPAGAGDDLRVYASLGAIQGVLGPFTPLGQEMIRGIFAGFVHLFERDATIYNQPIIHVAGERPWIDVTGALRNPIGRRIFLRTLPMVEPGAAETVRSLAADPRLSAGTVRPDSLARAAPFISRFLRAALQSFLRPEAAVQQIQSSVEGMMATVDERLQLAHTLDQRIDLCEWLCYNAFFPFLMPRYIPPVAIGYASLAALNLLNAKLAANQADIPQQLALDLTRGLPNNVTTEMDLELWQVAKRIRQDSASCALFRAADPEELAQDFHAKRLPASTQIAVAEFLDRYGMRGLAEIDFGQPRWREQPAPLMGALQSYLSIADEKAAPDYVFRQGQQVAERATERLAAAATRSFGSPAAGWLVRWLARRVRALAGLRESPKFAIIRLMGVARAALLDSGRELVAAGVLEQADDLFYLRLGELKVLAMSAPGDWKRLVRARRAAHRNEQRRQPVPRLLLSDGTAVYAGMAGPADAEKGALAGSGVSAGVVEGAVRVVFNPAKAELQAGEILVCPGTDPSWTPLFLAAGGLVMEMGGMMTHGSVVAREYGIPAVVGVDRATERLQTGQRVRVDGSSGRVQLLE